jgi:hypothetical protein
MRVHAFKPNHQRNPMLPEPFPLMQLQPHEITAPSDTIREFIDIIITRDYDPLICLWVALSHCYPFALNSPSLDLLREKLFGSINKEFIVYTLTACDYTVPGDPDKHERMYYGDKLGMWSGVDIQPSYDKFHWDTLSTYTVITRYTRSTEFIERFATKAFLYMYRCVGTGRDVAGIIARKVARMYLDDYKWMQSVPPGANGAEMVRMRVLREVTTTIAPHPQLNSVFSYQTR